MECCACGLDEEEALLLKASGGRWICVACLDGVNVDELDEEDD